MSEKDALTITAVQHMHKMRGGAQGHLMLADDDNLYVVKFQNNPQHLRVLTNEFIGTRLAEAVGLSVAACVVIDVGDWLIANNQELNIELSRHREPCQAGLQFGSRYAGGLMPGHVVDWLPEIMLPHVKNLKEFAGMLAFDKWTCNTDGRQSVFTKKSRQKHYRATFIDQGHCFNAGEWRWADAPLRGMFRTKIVYREIRGWQSFEPWLGMIESMPEDEIWSIAETVPPEWYDGQRPAMERLVEGLIERRGRIRELIMNLRDSDKLCFPRWTGDETIGG